MVYSVDQALFSRRQAFLPSEGLGVDVGSGRNICISNVIRFVLDIIESDGVEVMLETADNSINNSTKTPPWDTVFASTVELGTVTTVAMEWHSTSFPRSFSLFI